MLRIERDSDGCVVSLRLSGRIKSEDLESIRSAMNDECTAKVLDLTEITLIDIAAVQFLIDCENEGVELVHCPLYVREWILRERAEGGRTESLCGN